MIRCLVVACLITLMTLLSCTEGLKKGDCEVCVSVLTRFKETLSSDEASNQGKIEEAFRKYCKGLKTKENRFCYFLGGTADAATGIVGEMAKPLSWGMPVDKVCEKLKKKDRQICELTYEKQIDFKTVDLKKLKVKELKKILNDWDEVCDGCLEKGDYIKRIEALKPKHVRDEL